MTEIKTIDVHNLKQIYDTDEHLHLVDVREQSEWDEIHIPKAVHIPKNQINTIESLIPDHNAHIYLHCKGGTRSLNACATLMELGYKNVYSVTGGISAWAQAQYPVEIN